MAMDNPSYFTIPGGLNTGIQKASRLSPLKRHVRMGSVSSTPSPPSSTLSGPRATRPVPDERYSSPPCASPSRRSCKTVLASVGLDAPVQTQMLVMGLPRACDVAPDSITNPPFRSSSDLFSSYYNVGAAPPSRRHSIGAYFVRKGSSTLPRKTSGILEETPDWKEVLLRRPYDNQNKGTRLASMEDIIIISSQRSEAASLWVTYLKTCFDEIRRKKNKPHFKILCIAVEDIDDRAPMSPVLESKLRQARLGIIITCPLFLDFVIQYPERSCRLSAHLQPSNVLAMLLGVDEKSISDDHRAALVSFSQWKKMESVKDRDEKFVTDFLEAAWEILGRSQTLKPAPSTPEKKQLMLIPKKVNHSQKKVAIVLTEAYEKDDVLRVTIVRNGEETEVSGLTKRNPYTLAFRVPDALLTVTALVTVKVTKNGKFLGSKQLKCENQLHALEHVLKSCDQPLDFTCQALNMTTVEVGKLDEYFVKAFQRNIPPNFNLLQSAGLGQISRGTTVKEEFPTLLHFAAKFGLEQLSWILLECPGGDVACEIRNCKELTPAEIAEAAGHSKLSNLLSGYMQMAQFSSAYAFLKGMVDTKQEGTSTQSEEYLNPRPLFETYQVPPCPRPCNPPETPPPPTGYMPMKSPLGRIPVRPTDLPVELRHDLSFSREHLYNRRNSDEHSETKKKDNSNAAEEELIEIINDFKNNVFTITEVEALVDQWRRRNDVQQSFREKQEHLAKLREEYEKVQQKMREEMKDVGRLTPMERIRNFFRLKSKDGKETKKKNKSKKDRSSEDGNSSRPASSLSIISSSSSSSSRLSTGSGGDSSPNSEPESERRFIRLDNYDVPPSPIALAAAVAASRNYDVPPSPIEVPRSTYGVLPSHAEAVNSTIKSYDIPPSPVEVLSAISPEYCNMPPLPNESSLHGRSHKPGLKTVIEEERKAEVHQQYVNLSNDCDHSASTGGHSQPVNSMPHVQPLNPLMIVEPELDCHLPEYVNVEAQGIQLKCN